MNKVCISLKNFVNSFQKIKHRRRKKIILGEEKRLGNFDFKNNLENECFGSKLNLSNEKIGEKGTAYILLNKKKNNLDKIKTEKKVPLKIDLSNDLIEESVKFMFKRIYLKGEILEFLKFYNINNISLKYDEEEDKSQGSDIEYYLDFINYISLKNVINSFINIKN